MDGMILVGSANFFDDLLVLDIESEKFRLFGS